MFIFSNASCFETFSLIMRYFERKKNHFDEFDRKICKEFLPTRFQNFDRKETFFLIN